MKKKSKYLSNIYLGYLLGYYDIRMRYRRSLIGPLWTTINQGIHIGSIGIVFGAIFHNSMSEFLPFLSIGLIFWSFISAVINESCTAFSDSGPLIRQMSVKYNVFIYRVLFRNIMVLSHNVIVIVIVFLFFRKSIDIFHFIQFICGFIMAVLFLSSWLTAIAIVGARYRDLLQISSSVLQIAFYVTPLVWMPSRLENTSYNSLLNANPFYHLIELIRSPLLGVNASSISWLVIFILALLGWFISIIMYRKFHYRIAYWV